MKKIAGYLYILLFTIFLNSCVSSFKQVEVTEVQNVKVLNITDNTADLEVTIKISNPNKYNIKVKEHNLQAYVNKKPVGKIELADDVVMKKKSDNTYAIILKADMNQVKKLLPVMAFSTNAIIGIKGDMKVKARGLSKKIKIDVDQKVSTKEFKQQQWAAK